MSTKIAYYADLHDVGIRLSEKGVPTSWVHALPGGTYQHPVYGEMLFNEEKIANLASSVKNRVRNTDPDIDYDHKQDPAKGNMAAGWVKQADVRPSEDGLRQDLWVLVEWTPRGAEHVRNKEYRYFSSEICDEWTDAQGNKHEDVFLGGGVTNRPYMKNLVPLNLSDLVFKDDKVLKEGEQVDPKELRRKLGLAETATDAEVDTKLSEVAKLADPKPPNDHGLDVLAKLAEGNPAIKQFMEQQAALQKQLSDVQANLALSETNRQLTELTTTGKLKFSATVLNEVRDILVGAPKALSEKVFSVLRTISNGDGIVELGERSSSSSTGKTREDEDATSKFNTAITAAMADRKLSYVEAVEAVVRDDPKMYAEYRKSVYITDEV